jgi:two-component system OmpR family sensor kinase
VRRSIRVRLLVWVLALLVPLSVCAGWLLVEAFGNRLLHDFDVTLQEEAETIAELLATRASPDAVANLVAEIAGESDGGTDKYIVVTRQGQVIAQAPRTAAEVLHSTNPGLRVVRYDSADHSISVSIGASAAAALHAKQRLTSLLLIGIPAMLALLAASLWWLIGQALRPLENAARRLDQIAADNLTIRVPIDNPDDEVGRMVAVLNRMLDRLARAVSELQQFTADAAHELRTPLTVLRAGLEVALGRDRSAAEYRAALAEALASSERLARLADDLLTLARLDASAAPRAVELVDLSEVLHELADASADRAAQRQLTVNVTTPPELWVSGNAGDLYRLFNNLIDNALRHGSNGAGSEIAVSAEREGQQIWVSVADTGPGIVPEDLSRIFDRFCRGQAGRADAAGTGLGLSIAHEIARTHGGHITAANREGGGCVVTVSLPAAGGFGGPPLRGSEQ